MMLEEGSPVWSEAWDDQPSEAERQLTADRTETKYLVAPELALTLGQEIARHLPAHHFRGSGATILPDWLEYATTLYFDTAERDLYRSALANPVHFKLRAREYYSVYPPAPTHPPSPTSRQ